MLRKNFFLVLISLLLLLAVYSCRSSGGANAAMKRINETKDAKAAEVQKQYDAAMKQHMKNQSKKTRKQMKELKKKSKDFNDHTKGK